MMTLSTKDTIITGGCSFSANYVQQSNGNPPVQWTYDAKTNKRTQWKWEYQEPFAIWPDIIAKHQRLRLLNTASSGYGNDAIFHKTIDTIFQNRHRARLVVVMWSNWLRKDIQTGKSQWTPSTFNKGMSTTRMQYFSALYGIGAMSPYACIDYFFRYCLLLTEICRSLDIKLVMCQGTSFIKSPTKMPEYWNLYGINDQEKQINQQFMKDAIAYFIDHHSFDVVEQQNHLIDWPLFKQIGGQTFQDLINSDKTKYRLSDRDSHPNEKAHQMYAQKIIEKINE